MKMHNLRTIKLLPVSVLILLCLVPGMPSCHAGEAVLDSLERIMRESDKDLPDSSRAEILKQLCWYNKYKDPSKAFEYCETCLEIVVGLNDSVRIATVFNIMGTLYKNRGDYDKALDYCMRSLRIHEVVRMPGGLIGNKNGIAVSLDNMGEIYSKLGEYELAIDYYNRGLKIREAIRDRQGVAGSLNNIGIVYYYRGEIDEAIEYFQKSLDIKDELGDKQGIAISLNNIGSIYFERGNYDKAIFYFTQALRLDEELGSKHGIATRLNNLGEMYFSKAKEETKAGDRDLFFGKAITFFHRSIAVAREIDLKNVIKYAGENLSLVYAQLNNYAEALEYAKLCAQVNDSLFNDARSKEIGKLEAQYELETAEIERKRAANEQARLEVVTKTRRQNLQYSGISVLLILLVAILLLFSSKKVFRKKWSSMPKAIRLMAGRTWVMEGVIFFTFLMFFEFMLVLLDPLIELYSSGEPAFKLLVNSILAALIFPVHSFFETRLKRGQEDL